MSPERARKVGTVAGVAALLLAVVAAWLHARSRTRTDVDLPDPFVLRVDELHYLYATNPGPGVDQPFANLQVLRSSDLRTWEWVGDALPDLPSWAVPGRTWAPSIAEVGGRLVLYYAVEDGGSGDQCISVATADEPEGPFVDESAGPVICTPGGSIDPSPVVGADGAVTLLHSAGTPETGVRILAQAMAPDGVHPHGDAVPLVEADQPWEAGVVENPDLVDHDGTLVLLYSGNRWRRSTYAMGYAVCASVLGPCRKPADHPILVSHGDLAGPGGGSTFTATDGRLLVAHHAWPAGRVGYPDGVRRLHLSTLEWDGAVPVIGPGTGGPARVHLGR